MRHDDSHSYRPATRVSQCRAQYEGHIEEFGRHYGYDQMEMMVLQRRITRRLYGGLVFIGLSAAGLAWMLGVVA